MVRGCTARWNRFYAPPAELLRPFVEAAFARHRAIGRVETGLIDALLDPRSLGRPVISP